MRHAQAAQAVLQTCPKALAFFLTNCRFKEKLFCAPVAFEEKL
jgi:hypothetical protein